MVKRSVLSRYGVDNISKLDNIKKKKLLTKFGDENYNPKKYKRKYNVDNTSALEEVKQK